MQQYLYTASQDVREWHIRMQNCEVDTCFGQMWRCLTALSTILAYDMNCN